MLQSFVRLAIGCLAFAGLIRSAAAAETKPPARPGRPNILFIYTDDQSWRTLSCYGGRPWVRTPNIDRLAAEGTRFDYAYAASWCAPSRAIAMTGLLPHAIRGFKMTGILNASYDPAVCRFWPEELRKAGYRTTLIGKWHLGPDTGHGRAWDHSVVWNQADIRGDWYNDQPLSVDGAPTKTVPGYSTDVYTRLAVEEIERKHDKPWFMWLCYNAPHLPLTVHPRHKDRYKDAPVPIPPDVFGPRPGKPKYMREFTMWKHNEDDPDGPPMYNKKTSLPDFVRGYNRLVCAIDEGVGHLLDALEKTGQLDNTMIVYTSDQGFAIGERGFAWKVGPYEACMRMPLLVRMPGPFAKGDVCRHPVALVDLPPTFFALAGLPLPWEMHGHDLSPLLKNPRSQWDHPVLLEHFRWAFGQETDRALTNDEATGGVPWWLTIWKGQHKYVRTLVPDEIEEIYDFQNDPEEQNNLVGKAVGHPLLLQYREMLTKELQRTKAGLINNLPTPRAIP